MEVIDSHLEAIDGKCKSNRWNANRCMQMSKNLKVSFVSLLEPNFNFGQHQAPSQKRGIQAIFSFSHSATTSVPFSPLERLSHLSLNCIGLSRSYSTFSLFKD